MTIDEDAIKELPAKQNKPAMEIEQTVNKFEYSLKKIQPKFLEVIIRSIKKHCYDYDIGWSIVKSSTICFAGMLFSFQLKNLMRHLD